MDLLTRLFGTVPALRRWAMANLLANSGIVLTGGLVRLTGSGLGCSEWPKCSPDSYVALPEDGMHGAIEFGNRLLTFVLIAIAIGTFIAAVRNVRAGAVPPRVRTLSVVIALGIPFQGVIGGFTVWSGLNPYVVALHLMLSTLLISLCTWLVHLVYRLTPTPASPAMVGVGRAIYVVTWVVTWLGTLTTGSGPHAGDASSPRTGLDLLTVARVHAFSAWVLVALVVVFFVVVRNRAALYMLVATALQGVIGYIQYFAGLPRWMIALHLIGLCLTMIAATAAMLSVRRGDASARRGGAPNAASVDEPAGAGSTPAP